MDSKTARKSVEVGVLQSSILGPLQWNITFYSTLRVSKEKGCDIVCYANDTLVIATAEDVGFAAVRAGIQVARVFFFFTDKASRASSVGGENGGRYFSRSC